MKFFHAFLLSLFVAISSMSNVASAAGSAVVHHQLFSEIEQSLANAKTAHVDVLAPQNYGKAVKYYKSAKNRFYQNRGLADIREDIARSQSYLNQAMATTQQSQTTFASVIQARTNALSASAPQYAAEAWKLAEEEFNEAASHFEDGKTKNSREDAKKITQSFYQAELKAIKTNYLGGARNLIAEAKELKADRYATKTFIDAKLLLADAERELTENRYDTDYPRDLARRARNEAQHAITITKLSIGVKKKDFSVEDIITNYERPLTAIAGELDIVPSLHDGYDETETEIIKSVKNLQKRSKELDQSLLVRAEQAAEIARLSEILGVQSEQLAAEERFRALLANLESIFEPNEAEIFRQNKNMIIRMIGLNFDSNRAELKPEHLVLLAKVKEAIEISNTPHTTIEGHTDSYGSDASNLTLSEERANAVVEYLKTNMTLTAEQISAVGYGETRPIANNESVEGRAKNRRIDVVIKLTN